MARGTTRQPALVGANHPNPFDPQTTISFTLPEARRAEMAIYDAVGRLVRRLVRKHLTAGAHSTVWDGRTDGGTPAASGVYFCRLSTPAGAESSSLVMVRQGARGKRRAPGRRVRPRGSWNAPPSLALDEIRKSVATDSGT